MGIACGDCKHRLGLRPEPARSPDPGDAGFYCPSCRSRCSRTADCRWCGSTVCGRCGAIVESVADLGFG